MSSKIFGGSLLIAGTSIGAGVLAIPVLTAAGGFFPAICIYFLCWLFSIFSGYCYLEVLSWFKSKENVNLVSMVQRTLGNSAKVGLWIVYMILFYSLLIAYFCEGGNMVLRIFNSEASGSLIKHIAPIGFAVLVCPLLTLGTRVSDYFNRVCTVGLGCAFAAFCVLSFLQFKPALLLESSWKDAIPGFPIIFLAFGYQNVLPSLYYYMEGNVKDLKKTILIGSSIPFILYILWEALVLGVVPMPMLLQAKAHGCTAVSALKNSLHSQEVYVVGEVFSFFALVSSFIGVAIGVMDFFSDAFHWQKKQRRGVLFILTFLIPMMWAIVYPGIALKCLNYAGGLGVAFIVGVFPLAMVWTGRYGKNNFSKKHLLFGGKSVLLLMGIFILINFFGLIK